VAADLAMGLVEALEGTPVAVMEAVILGRGVALVEEASNQQVGPAAVGRLVVHKVVDNLGERVVGRELVAAVSAATEDAVVVQPVGTQVVGWAEEELVVVDWER